MQPETSVGRFRLGLEPKLLGALVAGVLFLSWSSPAPGQTDASPVEDTDAVATESADAADDTPAAEPAEALDPTSQTQSQSDSRSAEDPTSDMETGGETAAETSGGETPSADSVASDDATAAPEIDLRFPVAPSDFELPESIGLADPPLIVDERGGADGDIALFALSRPPAEFVAALLTLAAVTLAVGALLWVVRLGKGTRHIASQWRQRFAVLESKLDRAETIFNAQPDLVIIWDEDFDTPAEGWGRPKVLGNPATLATLLKYADKSGGTTPIENILDGLAKQDVKPGNLSVDGTDGAPVSVKPGLIEAIQDLRWNGQAFSLIVLTRDGRELEVEGRPAGAQAVIWLTDITTKARSINLIKDNLLEMRRESDQLRLLLDGAPFPVWRRSPDKKLIWVNQAFADAVEADRPETVVRKAIEIDAGARALTDRVTRSGQTGSEQRYVVIHGERRAYDMIEMPYDGGFVGLALDVTRKDAAEQELARHVTAHGETLDKLATGVAIFGPDRKLQYYNQAYAGMWKLDPAWLDTHPTDASIIDRLQEMRLLPEQADYKAWKKSRLDLFKKVTEQPDEIWHLPDSRHLRVACQPHPLGGLLFLYEDVTDRFRLESSLNTLTRVQRAMLDNLSEGVAVFGSDGKLELHNEAFVTIWHLDHNKLSRQPHFTRVVEWCRQLFDDEQEWMRMADRVTAFSDERHPLAGRLERKDGSFIDYALLPLPNGATLLTCLDVTDTTRITQALRERAEALETADRLKSEFLSHVSYQLRTPLTSIKGFTEMLESGLRGALTDEQKEYTSAIVASSDQLADLVDDILDLALIEAGVMTLDLSDIDLGKVLKNSAQLADQKTKEKGVAVALEIDRRLGQIYADERRIRQILFNLISNAVSFTGEGGCITIGGERSGDEVRLWVSDTGAGIDPGDQATVFDRFESRGANGRRRGPGLGLSLVKSFVELHGGWVSLESAPQAGTTVVCHLPIVAKAAAAKAPRQRTAAE